jgi:hypothetical protein
MNQQVLGNLERVISTLHDDIDTGEPEVAGAG